MLTIKDIDSMATSFAALTAATGRIVFGTRRTKLLKACVDWVQDFYRISATPTIVGLSENKFKDTLTQSLIRDEVRVNLKSQTSTTADAASPGPLKNEREWKQWEEKFTNYTVLRIWGPSASHSHTLSERTITLRQILIHTLILFIEQWLMHHSLANITMQIVSQFST